MSARNAWHALVVASLLSACGGEPPPVPVPPTPPAPEPVAAPAEPSSKPAATPTAEPSGKADATPPKSGGGGRPPVLKMDPVSITDTFGSAPAKLEIGEKEIATLKLPENALERGYNITFKLDPKGKSTQGLVGKIYRTQSQVAGEPAFTKVTSSGAPFELTLPAGSKKDSNLAIGEIITDDKGKEKVVWTIVAPTKIDDVAGTAHFELPFIADAYIHVTTKAVSAPPAAK